MKLKKKYAGVNCVLAAVTGTTQSQYEIRQHVVKALSGKIEECK